MAGLFAGVGVFALIAGVGVFALIAGLGLVWATRASEETIAKLPRVQPVPIPA